MDLITLLKYWFKLITVLIRYKYTHTQMNLLLGIGSLAHTIMEAKSSMVYCLQIGDPGKLVVQFSLKNLSTRGTNGINPS